MYANRQSTRLIAALGVVASLGLAPLAHAHEAGDLIVRVGGAWVYPNDSSGDVAGFPGNGVEVDDSFSAGLSISYMLNDRFSIDLLGAVPFDHDIKATGPDLGGLEEAKGQPGVVFQPQVG